MKRNLIIGIGFVLAVSAALFYFLKSEKTFFKETSLYQAIPVSVPMFAELNSLKAIPFDSPVFERWEDVNGLSDFNMWMTDLDSTIRSNSDIQNALRSNNFVVAFGLMGDNHITPLVIQKAESNNRQKSIANLVKTIFPEPEFEYSEFDYEGYRIVSGNTADNRKSINYCFASGLLIASPNLVLVQQSILQLTDPGIINNSSFKKLTETFTSEPEITWFINHKLFPDILLEFVNSSSINETNEFGENVKRNHYRNVRDFKKYASWSELEARFYENEILLQGLTIANDTTNDFLSIFEDQEPKRINPGEILPANTSYYTSYTFSDKRRFFNNLENYFSHGGSFYKREDKIRKIESGLRVDFKETFQRMVKSEFLVATSDIPKETEKKTNYFIFNVFEKSKTENLLDSVLSNYCKRKEIQLTDIKSEFVVNKFNNFQIIKFPYPSFPGTWLGKPFYFVQASFATFYKGYLVFCNTQEGLKKYLTNMENDIILADDYRFKRTMGKLENRANISSYFNFEKGAGLQSELLNLRLARKLNKKKDVLQRLHGLAWNVSAENEGFSNGISLIFDDGKSEEELIKAGATVGGSNVLSQNVVWKCNIGNRLITKPLITINHTNKNSRDVIVQDKSNKLYQLNHEGKIEWSYDVGESILSEIFQVDYAVNGKLQYLFSSKSKLYLVDRNGKNVQGFPISFSSKATSGVNVFDYDNKRQYRYFVPCDDKKIYAFDKHGKMVEGWNFAGTESEVITPVQHFRIKGKDYIVFKDEQTIYIQNRRGENIAKPNLEFENSNNPLILNPLNKSEILATDEKGKIFVIDFDGTTRKIDVGKFDDDHFFEAADLNGDNILEFVFTEGKKLTIVNEKAEVLFTKKFRGKIAFQPGIYNFGKGNKKVGIVDQRDNKIHLFDDTGKVHPGFPLAGSTAFSIGKINRGAKKLNLIVGDKKGVLSNYRLD